MFLQHASSCLAQRPPVGANFKQVELYNKLVTQKFQELKHKAQSTRVRKRSARETVKKLTLYLTSDTLNHTVVICVLQVWVHSSSDRMDKFNFGGPFFFLLFLLFNSVSKKNRCCALKVAPTL